MDIALGQPISGHEFLRYSEGRLEFFCGVKWHKESKRVVNAMF
jgi:hypothetical protein